MRSWIRPGRKSVPRVELNGVGGKSRRRIAVLAAIGGLAWTSVSLGQTWTGAVNSTWDTTTANWSSGTFTNGNAVTFDDSAAGSYAITLAGGTMVPSSVDFENSDGVGKDYSISNGAIFGSSSGSASSSAVDGVFTLGNGGNVTLSSVAASFKSYTLIAGQLTLAGNTTLSGYSSPSPIQGHPALLFNQFNVYSQATVTMSGGTSISAVSNEGCTFNLYGGELHVLAGASVSVPVQFYSAYGYGVPTIQLDAGSVLTKNYGAYCGVVAGSGTLVVTDDPNSPTHGAGWTIETPSALGMDPGTLIRAESGGAIILGAENTSSPNYYAGSFAVGAGLTLSLSGTGSAGGGGKSSQPNGALRSSAGNTDTWQGNIVIEAAGATLGGGPNGQLTVTGSISGTGPIFVSRAAGSVTIFAGSNNYSGDTTVAVGQFIAESPLLPVTGSLIMGSVGATGSLAVPASATASVLVGDFNQVQITTGTSVSVLPTDRSANLAEVLVANAVSVAGTGSLNLGDNDAILHAMTEPAVRALVSSKSITSTSTGALTGLGVITNSNGEGGSLYATFDGVAVSASDVLVKFTYLGDTTLKGYVDGTDLANTLAGLSGHLTGWENGDFNYDGVVSQTDLNLLLASLAGEGTSLGGPTGGGAAVPEPSSLALAVAAAPLLARRSARRMRTRPTRA